MLTCYLNENNILYNTTTLIPQSTRESCHTHHCAALTCSYLQNYCFHSLIISSCFHFAMFVTRPAHIFQIKAFNLQISNSEHVHMARCRLV